MKYKVPYTQTNCELFQSTHFLTQCSHAQFYGVGNGNGILSLSRSCLSKINNKQFYIQNIVLLWGTPIKNSY